MPYRTTIVLPPELEQRAVSRARRQGISLGEFVRGAVEKQVALPAVKIVKPPRKRQTGDPLWDNLVTFSDDGPPDLSTRIDEFLYDNET